MIGQTLSHFRITAKLGEGGMGEVYLAEDSKLGRKVAVKVLPMEVAGDPERLQRFVREAQAVAALNHPNIVTIHSVEEAGGVHLLTMELVEGKSLAELLPADGFELRTLLPLAIQIADALVGAHDKGVIHRDLKPGNVMVTDAGRVKLLDFGLAKLVEDEPEDEETQLMTRDGVVLGTVPYMSPEQVQGRPIDHRTDLFSLGALLYEMATGRRPFRGDNAASVISSVLKEEPPPLVEMNAEMPRQLGRIVHHCLEKEPDRRVQSALDLRNRLEALDREIKSGEVAMGQPPASTGPTAPPEATKSRLGRLAFLIVFVVVAGVVGWWMSRGADETDEPVGRQSVAVLPFVNRSADASLDYLRLAVPDEVTTVLSRSDEIATRPFSTTASLQDGELDVSGAGRDLGVVTVVAGQFFREGEELQLTLEAIDVERNQLIWRESVRVGVDDLISLRERVADRVRQDLLPVLGSTSASGLEGSRPTDGTAYELFLRALAVPTDQEPTRRAIEMLERVVEMDPEFAPAWVALADRYLTDYQFATGEKSSLRKAEEAAARALELDPALASARLQAVQIDTETGRLGEAYREIQRLLKLRPNDAYAHFQRSYLLRYAGLFEESKRSCEEAFSLDPTDRRLRTCARSFFLTGSYDRARDFLEVDDGSEMVRHNRVASLLRQGKREEAHEILAGAEPGLEFFDLTLTCLDGWPPTEHDRRIREMETAALAIHDPEAIYWTGAWLAYCEAPQSALRQLRLAVLSKYCATEILEIDPMLVNVRDDPEYAAEFQELVVESRACQERFLAEVGGI